MKMKKAQALALIAGLMVASMAPAAHAAAEVKMGGVMFAQYLYNLDDKAMPPDGNTSTKGRNSFDVTRLYVNGDVKFDDNWKAKFILEARTEGSGASASNAVFLKGAFLEYGNLMDTGMNVQFGQIPLSWDAFEGGIHNRRYVMQQFPNRYMSLATWDKGVGVYGKLPAGFGDYNAQVFNGNGETATEGTNGNTGRTKAASLLMSIVPVPNMEALSPLRLNAFVQQEKQGLVDTGTNQLMPSREKNYWFAGASYKTKNWHAMGTYYHGNVASGATLATNAHTRPKGYSLHGSYSGLPWETTVFVRRDRFDAGVNQAPSTVAYAPRVVHVVGLEKKMADGVRFAIADTMDYTRNVGANTSSWLHTLGLYAEAKF